MSEMFCVHTTHGYIPLSRISRITEPPAPRQDPDAAMAQIVHYTDATGEAAEARVLHPIFQSDLLPAIPAPTGYEALRVVIDPAGDEPPTIRRSPIIAWRLDGERAIPITAEPLEDHDGIGICTPEGSVFGPGPGDNVVTPEQWLPMMIARLQF